MRRWYHLRAWNWMYNASETYIRQMELRAEVERAPKNAIYQTADGRWKTSDDILDPNLRREIIAHAKEMEARKPNERR